MLLLDPVRFVRAGSSPFYEMRGGSPPPTCVAHNGRVSSLTGRLLVAVPRPHDGDEGDLFTRSVVFVLHHDDEGAQGLVLDYPLEAGVDSVLPGWQDVVSSPDRLFQGGPVGLDRAIALANVPGRDEVLGTTRLFGSLSLVDLDAPPALVAAQLAGMRVFAGSAGWEAGQLDTELADDWWFVADYEIGDLFDDDPDTLWQRVVRRQPFPLNLMATFPDDPSLN